MITRSWNIEQDALVTVKLNLKCCYFAGIRLAYKLFTVLSCSVQISNIILNEFSCMIKDNAMDIEKSRTKL